ncbi:MAG: 23S rRNA (pseudouridine(1915)-N(3))-methyltransferase RlmH [Cytophagales bacterium]
MNIKLLAIGKTDQEYLKEGVSLFEKRLKFYTQFELKVIPDLKNSKNLSEEQQKSEEGKLILKEIQNTDFVVVLDDKGKQLTSIGLSKFIDNHQINSTKTLVLIIGGPYGFSEEVYARANYKWSLSLLTFSHQMIRLFVVEQLYRAYTILKGEPYHHE